LPGVSSNDTQVLACSFLTMQKKKIKIISKVFEYTHFMDKINVVLEIECNLMKDIQWPCLGLIL